MTDPLKEIRARIASSPTEPGVYRWLDGAGDVLYVGKAKNVRNRLRSYVQQDAGAALGPWKTSLMTKVKDFTVTVTANELEALILETNLIKELKPKYNVLMKDDKNYVYVRVGTDMPYPPVSVVRRMEEDKAKYFGPFLSSYELNRTLDLLHDLFKFRACQASVDALNAGRMPQRECVEAQIGQCNGLCAGRVSQDTYRSATDNVMRFLKGDRQGVVAELKTQMAKAAADKKFERAAKLRDVLATIDGMGTAQVVSGTDGMQSDIIGIALSGQGKAHTVVFRIRNGKLIEERSVALRGDAETLSEAIAQFLPQYYSAETDIPDTVVIGEAFDGMEAFEQWLSERRGRKTELRVPERGKKSKLLMMAETNALKKIEQQYAKWETAAKNVETALKELQDALGLKAPPKRIEGYDISHLGGTETVGSMVVIKNGKSSNADYRSFTLRTVSAGEIDDYKALREVLRRRLQHCVKRRDDALPAVKLKKKERGAWREGKTTLAVPKGWREETLVIGTTDAPALTLDLRKKNPKTPVYALAVFGVLKGKELHSALDTLEHALGKQELYVVTSETPDEDILALHGLLLSVKPMPEEFAPVKEARTYHRRRTVPDASLTAVPDLLVIDGGKGQLSAVTEVLKDIGADIPAIGLAKREEEIFLPGSSLPVYLPKESQAQFLLQRLRDEAHRSANLHREKRVASKEIGSALDLVAGIGPKTKKELLMKFGSVEGIRAASDAELREILSEAQLEGLRDM